jgi:catechol 2,3-dioxygenase
MIPPLWPNTDTKTETPYPIYPSVRIGHVHLRVSDLQRSIDFYRSVLGFEVMQRFGQQAAFPVSRPISPSHEIEHV